MLISSRCAWRPVIPIDLSAHGAQFSSADVPAVGTRLSVAVRVPCHMLRLTGAIVRNELPCRAAIEFDPLTPAQHVLLNTVLLDADAAYAAQRARHAVLVLVGDPEAQMEIVRAIWSCGFRPIARATPLDVVHGLDARAATLDGVSLRAAVVATNLPSGAGHDVLEYLADACPHVRRAVLVEPDAKSRADVPRSAVDCVLLPPYRPHQLAPLFAGIDGRAIG